MIVITSCEFLMKSRFQNEMETAFYLIAVNAALFYIKMKIFLKSEIP